MITDISESKQAADDIKRVNEELRRSNVEVEHFAHVASHDLQEPLRMVSSYLQLIERRYAAKFDEDGREFLHFAVDGALRMKALINDLLGFARAGANLTKLLPVPAESIVKHAIENLRAAIDESDAEITIDPLPTISVERGLVIQVFQNLIANAIKFQAKGFTPRIHISCQRQGGEWVFSVGDNGLGIESRYQDRIFKVFERLHTLEEYSGSGIGLAIVKKIVETHAGKIWVESQPGVGSTFYFYFSSAIPNAMAANVG
jgi:light-regulated signal transduction histidine kinase (bacteriophytochrome)